LAENFEKIKGEKKPGHVYEHIMDFKMKNWNFNEKKSIKNFGYKAGLQHCLDKKLNREFNRANKISVDKKQVFNEILQHQDRHQKMMKRIKKNKKSKTKEQKMPDLSRNIKGIQPDGFDYYKPTKMLKKKEWNKGSCTGQIKGVVLKIDSTKGQKKIGKDALFEKVFLKEKKAEIDKMEKELREKMKKEGLTKADITKKLTRAEKHNKEVLDELKKFVIEPQYGNHFNCVNF
jgi:hypothetical protein